MTTTAPEFTAPMPDWGNTPVSDAPSFTPPKQEKPRAPIFGGARKSAESNKRTAPRARTSKPKSSVPPSKEGQFVDDLTQIYSALAVGLYIKDPQCAQVIMEQAEKCAVAWDKLAVENDAVRRALFALTKATGLGAVVAAHVPIAMAVMAHHGPGLGPKVVADDNEDVVEDILDPSTWPGRNN